ncbi:MAG: DUF819 family protein, partial [Candidatus Omnitrophica bacterium]|nr:DUF819 family protein [Candidatus Omnitrophota bacterium]
MNPLIGIVAIVALVLSAERLAWGQCILRYLPPPLWCYLLPMVVTTLGWLPQHHATYGLITTYGLPFALALLLLNVHLPSVWAIGRAGLLAMAIGMTSIVVGLPLVAWCLRHVLPAEAWKGVGTLAATWTGGSMNLLALRGILQTPEQMFTALMVTDAVIAYGWMALLIAISSRAPAIDRWLQAVPSASPAPSSSSPAAPAPYRLSDAIGCVAVAAGLTCLARMLASALPSTSLITSSTGWAALLVTTLALSAAALRPVQRLGRCATRLGVPVLYLVLATMGAQASLQGFRSAPVWLAIGAASAVLHGCLMLAAGRWLRLPLGLLATASQANFGGVISAPLVGAVYHERLVPVGLCLALLGNALGTYLG